MKHIKLFENFSEDAQDIKIYLDQNGYYKGDGQSWAPSQEELYNFLNTLESMGFKIKESHKLFEAILDIEEKLIYKLGMTIEESTSIRKGNKLFPITKEQYSLGGEAKDAVRSFLTRQINYDEYVDIMTNNGKDMEEILYYAFGKEMDYRDLIKLPGKSFLFKEDYEIGSMFKKYENGWDSIYYNDDLEKIGITELGDLADEVFGHRIIGFGLIDREIFDKLPFLIQNKVKNLNSLVNSGKLERKLNRFNK